MVAFVLSADTNIDALASKAGGDTYDTNGFKLTIDQDSRTGLNQTTTSSLGSMTINASKGGEIHIDGTGVWLIPYTGGGGVIPAWNTVISNGSGSGKLIGVQTTISGDGLLPGGALTSTGFIRIKQKTGTFAAGALTGITATASNAGTVGWIEILGDEAATVNANRLGTFRVTGAWYSLGVTTGAANYAVQLPKTGAALARYCPGVFVGREAPRTATYTKVGSVITFVLASHAFVTGMNIELAFTSGNLDNIIGTFEVASVIDSSTFTVTRALGADTSGNCSVEFLEFYPNRGIATQTNATADATRHKCCYIASTGQLTIGSNVTQYDYIPPAGRSVVVPNIFFENCATASRNSNALPNSSMATRYDFTCTGGGVLDIDKASMNWYLSASQAFSVKISNSCTTDTILLNEVASPIIFNKVGIGNKVTTALITTATTITYCFAGGVFTDCVFTTTTHSVANSTATISDSAYLTFTRCTFRANAIRGNASTYSVNMTRVKFSTFTRPIIIQGAMLLTTCDNITTYDVLYCESVNSTTVITYVGYVWNVTARTTNCLFSGLTIPITNTHPYTALMLVAVASSNIKLRNIGTRASPLSLGTLNACGLIYALLTAADSVKVQRVYCSNTRTGIMTGDNSCKNITEENVFGDYADAVDVMACLSMKRKGMGGTGAYTAQTSVYGTHWMDHFTSTTTGRIAILMNESTADTAARVALTGGAGFTSVGGLYMPVIGQTATFETPEYIIGHTDPHNAALVMAGGTVGNYRFEYSIDKNDGNGWSAMTASSYTAALLGTALSGITGIDASKGFKLKLKITTGTTNTTAITSVYVLTNSTTTAQDYQYPLDTVTITLQPNVALTGAEVRIYDMDNVPTGSLGTELAGIESAGAGFSFSTTGGNTVWIQIMKPGYQEFGYEYTTGLTDATLPVILQADINT